MSYGDLFIYGVLSIHACVLVLALVAYYIKRASWKRLLDTEKMPISILKPLCGVDDDLEKNLESFFHFKDKNYQLIFATASADDPARAIAQKLIKRYPEIDASLHLCEKDLGASPKVSLLMQMVPFAKHDLFLLSDSNVVVDSDYLDYGRVAFRNPKVGMAHNPVIGIHDQNVMAAMEGSYLTDNCGIACIAIKYLFQLDAVTGKSMFLRRQVIEGTGGLKTIRNLAADDHFLGVETEKQGWKVALIPDPVKSVMERRTLKSIIVRHIRWNLIRWTVAPYIYPFEHFMRPTVLAALLYVVGLCSATTLGLALVARYLFHTIASLNLKRQFPSFKTFLGLPLIDLVMTYIWITPFLTNKVSWRGNVRCMAKGTRMVTEEVYMRAIGAAGRKVVSEPKPAILTFPSAKKQTTGDSKDKRKAA